MSLSHDTLRDEWLPDDIERTLSSETVLGFKVAAYREPHPEHGTKYGHRYSEHWSTPNYNLPVERLFTEAQLRFLIAERDAMRAALEPFAACCDYIADTEDDEEWAKFRLLIKHYRAAKSALGEEKAS